MRGASVRLESWRARRWLYEHWLAALERFVTAKGLIDRAALELRKEMWADAYRYPPHAQPVDLSTAHSMERYPNHYNCPS